MSNILHIQPRDTYEQSIAGNVYGDPFPVNPILMKFVEQYFITGFKENGLNVFQIQDQSDLDLIAQFERYADPLTYPNGHIPNRVRYIDALITRLNALELICAQRYFDIRRLTGINYGQLYSHEDQFLALIAIKRGLVSGLCRYFEIKPPRAVDAPLEVYGRMGIRRGVIDLIKNGRIKAPKFNRFVIEGDI